MREYNVVESASKRLAAALDDAQAPALGAISLSVLRAANALVIPVPPTLMDFSSTAAFLAMLDETLEDLAQHELAPTLNFLRVVASKVDENKSIQRELLALMRQVFGLSLIRTPLKDSAEIDNVTARLMTVYELDEPMTSKAVRDRCLTYLNGVNEEILVDIRSTWPSHAQGVGYVEAPRGSLAHWLVIDDGRI